VADSRERVHVSRRRVSYDDDNVALKIDGFSSQKLHSDDDLLDIEQSIDGLAKAIYNVHRSDSSPTWENSSDDVKDWLRAQARAVKEYYGYTSS
jgi:hypothetical protein